MMRVCDATIQASCPFYSALHPSKPWSTVCLSSDSLVLFQCRDLSCGALNGGCALLAPKMYKKDYTP